MKRKASSTNRPVPSEERPTKREATFSHEPPKSYYWIRQQSGTILYENLHPQHILPIKNEFNRVLEKHFRNHTLTTSAYAPSKSDPGKFDVQFHFENKIPNETKVLMQRTNANTNRFELYVKGNHYEPVLGKVTGTDWRPIEGMDDRTNDLDRSPAEIKRFVVEYLQSSPDENIRAFHSVMQNGPLLLGPCQTKSASKPCIFPYQDCWRKTFDKDQLLQTLLRKLFRGNAYRADNAHHPAEEGEALHAIAIRQTLGGKKQDEPAHFVVNIPLEEESSMQIPPILRASSGIESSNSTTVSANIAPRDCVVDIHIGMTRSENERI